MELDRLFDQRRASPITVSEVFVDRRPHIDTFDATVRRLGDHAQPAATAPPQRSNLLVFYGLGGIGKTSLSKRLERRFRDGEHEDAAARRPVCRINLDDPALTDLETLVIIIRSAVGEHLGRCPAFDLALSVYWQRSHPGLPMGAVLERNSALRRFNGALELPRQLDESLNALLGPVPLAGLARQATGLLVGRIRDKIRRDRLLTECPGFAEVLETESPRDMLPFLPALLSWDLAQHHQDEPVQTVVFMDTFERVDGQQRVQGCLEDQFSRLMYLMPNVLFVVTGRNRLTWGDGHHGAIHYSGSNYWPALAAAPPAPFASSQQRLSGLKDDDADGYLRFRLTHEGEPAIPGPIRQKIIDSSGGVPLYLELSAEYFDQLAASGQSPDPEGFGGTFAEMVIRVMRDLTFEERALLRASSMVDRFDAELLRAAVPEVRDAAVERFLARPIVQVEDSGWLPRSVDEYIRDAVREHDPETDDAWSENEWRVAADRMVDDLRTRLREDVKDPTTADPARLIQGFSAAGRLSLRTGRVPDWLYDMAYALRLHHHTGALEAVSSWTVPAGHPLEAFILTCQGMAQRSLGDREASARLLERAASHPRISPYARLFIKHRYVKALEEVGRYREAEDLAAEVAAAPSTLRETAAKDLAWISWIRGDGRRLLAWALPNRASTIGFHRAQALDLLGQFHMLQGDLAAAEQCFHDLVDDPELEEGGILRDTGWRHLGMVMSLRRPLDAETVLDRALQVNRDLEVGVGIAQTHIWRGVARTGTHPASDAHALIARGEELLDASNGLADRWMVLLARTFLAAVDGTDSEVLEAARTLMDHVREQDCHPGLAEVAARWLAVRGVAGPSPVESEYWLDRSASQPAREAVLRERRDARRA
jgi:tetratricopeptide (TPR) repeat protein